MDRIISFEVMDILVMIDRGKVGVHSDPHFPPS